jgi:thioredoxin 1
MSDASDAGDPDDIEAIKERKKEELAAKLDDEVTGADEGPGADEEPNPESDGLSDLEPVHVESEAHLDELVGDRDVVLVDFHADWCGPCQMLEPVVESVAAETDATVAKVDVDAHQGLAREYGVQGVPTLFLFADGEPAERLVGMQDESRLRSLVEQYA